MGPVFLVVAALLVAGQARASGGQAGAAGGQAAAPGGQAAPVRQAAAPGGQTAPVRQAAAPAGLYAYEQQRLLWNKTDHPLVQPYAAFSSGQLVTLAVEGLIEKYAGGRALNALTGAQRAKAQGAARAEVSRAIAEFCAAQ